MLVLNNIFAYYILINSVTLIIEKVTGYYLQNHNHLVKDLICEK